jgi:hypothetical protein
MCIEILKNPVAAIIRAKKKNTKETWTALVCASVLFAIATGVAVLRSGGFSQVALPIAAVTMVSVFVVVLIISIVLGYILKIIVTTLGGSGKYHEGLTIISYSILPISAALLVAVILTMVPAVGVLLSVIVLAAGFATGLSLLYRGIKELFKTDMVVALIAVSVLILVLFVSLSASFGLSTLMQLGRIVPIGV